MKIGNSEGSDIIGSNTPWAKGLANFVYTAIRLEKRNILSQQRRDDGLSQLRKNEFEGEGRGKGSPTNPTSTGECTASGMVGGGLRKRHWPHTADQAVPLGAQAVRLAHRSGQKTTGLTTSHKPLYLLVFLDFLM